MHVASQLSTVTKHPTCVPWRQSFRHASVNKVIFHQEVCCIVLSVYYYSCGYEGFDVIIDFVTERLVWAHFCEFEVAACSAYDNSRPGY